MENKAQKQKLVLVPGMAGDKRFFRHITDHLEDIADITVPVLARCKSRDEMAEAVISSVEGKFSLAGTSMGGWVSYEVIRRIPERILRFAPIATWARPIPDIQNNHRKLLEKIKKGDYKEIIAIYHKMNPDKSGSVKDLLAQADKEEQGFINPRVVINHMTAYLDDFDSTALLANIKCPTLAIAGRKDEIFPVREHEFIIKHIKGAKLAVINDCGHFIAKEQPQALSALLRYWLTYF